jgi:hypothetical protein
VRTDERECLPCAFVLLHKLREDVIGLAVIAVSVAMIAAILFYRMAY